MSAINRRILVIDDNRAIHEDFRKILKDDGDAANLDNAAAAIFGEAPPKTAHLGFEIDSALQGQEGLERVQQALGEGHPYAMAFVDVRMPPGWDGVETIARIWEVYPDLQVVMCTAYSDYSWDEMIARVGQSDRLVILKKPFDNVEVLQLANALSAKWQLLQETRANVHHLEARVRERTKEIEAAHATLQAEIGERNKMEVQLRHSQKLQAIGQLAAGISHEINTPVQFIGDNTRFLGEIFGGLDPLLAKCGELIEAGRRQSVTPELVAECGGLWETADISYLRAEVPSALRQTLEGVERISKIVRAMKDFSHPGTEEKAMVDLNKLVESTLTVSRNEWKYVADLVTDFDPTLTAVPCLPGEFNQVILNLVVNAAHAISDALGPGATSKGTLTVTTRRIEGWAEVSIADTGTGIPESARPHIFEPFFTTKEVGRGTGQGLAIAHSVIVDKHGGTIHFETQMGQGTMFILRLPLVAAIPKDKPGKTPATVPGPAVTAAHEPVAMPAG